MHRPLDHHVGDRVGMVRAARLFSNIVSPPVMFACVGLALAWHELSFWPGLIWGAIYGFFVSLMPIMLVLHLLRSGRIAELHMTDTRERHLPYLVAVLGSVIFLGLILVADGPEQLRCLAWFNIVTLTVIAAINTRWLISFHATAAVAMVLVIGLVFGPLAGLLLLPLLVGVVAVRLYLRRHTLAQVLGGLLLGSLAVFAMNGFGCFQG